MVPSVDPAMYDLSLSQFLLQSTLVLLKPGPASIVQTDRPPVLKYHFLQSLSDLYDHAAVGFIDSDFFAVHDQQALLIVHGKESNAAVLMINGSDMLVIREYTDVLRVASADGQTADIIQKARLRVAVIDGYRVVACVTAEHVLLIGG